MEQTVVTKTEHKKRKPKTMDNDIKEYFSNYIISRNKVKEIQKHRLSRELTQEEQEEVEYLKEGMELDEAILDCFPDRERYVLQQFYLEHRQLYPISLSINYGYEYTSALKIQCDSRIRRLMNGQAINSNIGKILYEDVKEYLSATMK